MLRTDCVNFEYDHDKHYEEPLENQYWDKDYTSKWSPSDPKSRPFKYSVEIFNNLNKEVSDG